MNLATVDVMGIYGFTQYGGFLVTSPIMIVVSLSLIFTEVGVMGLFGVLVMFIGTFASGKIGFIQMKIRQKTLTFADKRAKMMSEYINGMRILKYQGWELFALSNINEVRKGEAQTIFQNV